MILPDGTEVDLKAIRERDAACYITAARVAIDGPSADTDRRALLRIIDALMEAAWKVPCERCGNTGYERIRSWRSLPLPAIGPCPDCYDLLKLGKELR